MLKNLIIMSTLFGIVLMSSCEPEELYEVNFKSQVPQGNIGSQTWTMNAGMSRSDAANGTRFCVLSGSTADDPCTLNQSNVNRVMFTFSNSTGLKESEILATFYDAAGNYIGQYKEGAVEITDINDASVVGKVDLYIDDNTFVNGTFSVPNCD